MHRYTLAHTYILATARVTHHAAADPRTHVRAIEPTPDFVASRMEIYLGLSFERVIEVGSDG